MSRITVTRDARLIGAAVSAVLVSLVAAGVLPGPWDTVVTAVLAGLGVLLTEAPRGADGAQDTE